MKKSVLIIPLLVMATATAAVANENVEDIKVYDHTKIVTQSVHLLHRRAFLTILTYSAWILMG